MTRSTIMRRLRSILTTRHSFWEIAIALATILAFLVAANGYEDIQLDSKRRAAESSYFELIGNLGSENVVVRVGAIGQIESVLGRAVPLGGGQPRLWEGFAYLVGLHEHPSAHPYHESLLRVISVIALSPKEKSEASRLESEALLKMLCAIGPDGWYQGEPPSKARGREDCLAWIWKNAPKDRISDLPSYSMFRRSELLAADFSRYNLQRADFSEALLEGVDFTEADLRFSLFNESALRGASFVNANLEGCNLQGATLDGVDFAGADLRGADFTGCVFSRVELGRAQNVESAIGIPANFIKDRVVGGRQ